MREYFFGDPLIVSKSGTKSPVETAKKRYDDDDDIRLLS
jgi:hypothetical protein